MSDRKQLEKKDNWQATFRHLREDVREPFDCLMRTISGGFYWETPDYDGLFSWGATREFTLRYTAELLIEGTLKMVKGKMPDCLKAEKKKIRREKKTNSFDTEVDVCCHRVALRYWDFTTKLTPELETELTDHGEERAKECIIDGCHSGELNCLHTGKKEEEIRGWWEIIKS